MNKKPHQQPDPKEVVLAALNEQGFLFQQIIREKVRNQIKGDTDTQAHWTFVACEYPVTAADGSQTRIDLVLQHAPQRGIHICMECKRALAPFKQWVFFDRGESIRGVSEGSIFVETVEVRQRPVREWHHALRSLKPLRVDHMCPVFNYYLEAGIKLSGAHSKTDNIEKAFRQTILGHTGMMAKLWDFDSEMFLRSIPVVVTTAEMFEAQFDSNRIDLTSGTIAAEDLNLVPLEFCAVNYRPDDSTSMKIEGASDVKRDAVTGLPHLSIRNIGVSGNEAADVITDLTRNHIRTVFVVRAGATNKFLNWAHERLTS